MFDNLTDRLSRTLRNISGRGRLTEDNVKDTLREVRMALLEADVALPVVREFINRVKEKAVGHEVNKSLTPGQEFVKIVRNELVAAMGEENQTLNLAAQPPAVVLMAGLQGAGKTTSVGKLGKFLREKHKKKVLVVSADVYRPAAIKQLETLAEQVGVDFFPSDVGQKPVDIVNAALKEAKLKFYDVLLVDTAGRLQIDDVLMQETVDSIMQFGVLNPTIIRPDPGGGYEMVAGHRRLHASGLAGKDTIPAIVRNLTDDEAVILLVDTNLQRENISPMERAQAYKMKMEALKHQGQRTDLTLVQVGPKLNSAEKIAQDSGESVSQVKRLIRLTELVPEIQQKVDAKEIALNPAVELSYLKPEEQRQFLDAMEYSQNTPSLSQAQRLKKLSREGKCTQDAMYKVMSEEKKDELDRVTLKSDTLRKYFPKNYTPQQMEQVIIKLLDQWQKKRQRQNER